MTRDQTNTFEDPLFDATVAVVCDSDEHARGKVTTLATFSRLKTTDSWLVTSADRGRQWTKHKAQGRRSADPQEKIEEDPEYKCKLCGRGLPPISACKNTLLPALNQAVVQGESSLSLLKLRGGSI